MKEQWSKQKVIDRKWQTEAKLNEEKRERCYEPRLVEVGKVYIVHLFIFIIFRFPTHQLHSDLAQQADC